jgi:hypothetical protein
MRKVWTKGGIDKPHVTVDAVVSLEELERSHPKPTAIDKSAVIGNRHWVFGDKSASGGTVTGMMQ